MNTKYIDSEKLIAEIDNIYSEAVCEYNSNKSRYSEGAIDVVRRINSLITSLQQEQPEVDLEKEIEEWWQNWASPPRNEYAVFNKEEFINLARHFYELGRLNARKED